MVNFLEGKKIFITLLGGTFHPTYYFSISNFFSLIINFPKNSTIGSAYNPTQPFSKNEFEITKCNAKSGGEDSPNPLTFWVSRTDIELKHNLKKTSAHSHKNFHAFLPPFALQIPSLPPPPSQPHSLCFIFAGFNLS